MACAKLESMGVHPFVVAYMTSILVSRSRKDKLESSLPDEVPAPSGVLQVVSRCYLLLTDATKIRGCSVDIQADLFALNAVKYNAPKGVKKKTSRYWCIATNTPPNSRL